jgi:spore germination protein YaaH
MRLAAPALLVALLELAAPCASAAPKSLFYLTRDPAGIASFIAHAHKIDILVPTWYNVDPDGNVKGAPDPNVMRVAQSSHVPVMPIVVNPGFNQNDFHKLLGNPAARAKMIAALVAECQAHSYIGIQFDFENVIYTDRDALTNLVAEAAASLHANALQLSIATVPNAPGVAGDGAFSKWIYNNWRLAYDLKGIGAAVDLLCLMTYDEHTRYTPPGPVAGQLWTKDNLDYALKVVPKEKLSLGIPVYGYRWYAGDPVNDKPGVTVQTVGGDDVRQLIAKFHPEIQWDTDDRATWFRFYRDATREWVYYTDRRTFQARYDLVTSSGIQGFCSWVLGKEDPAIWELLPEHK